MTRGKGSKMDYKRKLDYLYGYKNKMARIRVLIEEHDRWMAIGAKVNQAYSADAGGSHGDGSSRVEISAIELAKIDDELKQAVRERDKILRTIRTKSRHKRYQEILELRFIGGLSYNKLSDAIDKDVRTVQRVVRRAVETLEI